MFFLYYFNKYIPYVDSLANFSRTLKNNLRSLNIHKKTIMNVYNVGSIIVTL